MKKRYLIIFISLWHSLSLLSQEVQYFNLDTIVEKEITGKKGTVIYFLKDDLNVSPNSKLTLELRENYNGKKNTIESLKFSFKSDKGKQIMLKKGKKLEVFLPNNNLKYQEHKIFHSEKESKNVKWIVASHLYDEVIILLGGGIYTKISLHKDSIAKKVKSGNRKFLTKEEYNKKYPRLTTDSYNFFIPKNLKSVFIPNFIKVKKSISFNFKKKGNKYFQPRFFIYYENLKMYSEITKFPNDPLNFKDIPVFEKTFLIVIKEDYIIDRKKSVYYSDKIKLNQNLNNKLLNPNLKKTTKEDLKRLFE
ncbi:hypothetical protein [uncultured Tenacibaculum sp.]|uniref:hypothetical protein n=1 Tax=uncultured Tenacibaculum sp. TaxID=174713 RepID=UPI00261DA6B9|nr:hypothetical protein [uncultured Tenacibaculum sp.]